MALTNDDVAAIGALIDTKLAMLEQRVSERIDEMEKRIDVLVSDVLSQRKEHATRHNDQLRFLEALRDELRGELLKVS